MNNIIEKTFKSIDDKHSFNIMIIEDTAYFEITSIESKYYKSFLLILKDGFDYMCKYNVKYVKQTVTENDIEFFNKSEIIKQNNKVIIKTNINDFLIEICDALAIQHL